MPKAPVALGWSSARPAAARRALRPVPPVDLPGSDRPPGRAPRRARPFAPQPPRPRTSGEAVRKRHDRRLRSLGRLVPPLVPPPALAVGGTPLPGRSASRIRRLGLTRRTPPRRRPTTRPPKPDREVDQPLTQRVPLCRPLGSVHEHLGPRGPTVVAPRHIEHGSDREHPAHHRGRSHVAARAAGSQACGWRRRRRKGRQIPRTISSPPNARASVCQNVMSLTTIVCPCGPS